MNRRLAVFLAAVTLWHLPLATNAADQKAATAATAGPGVEAQNSQGGFGSGDPLDENLLPAMNFDNVTLEDAIAQVRKAEPALNCVVVRGEVPANYPMLHLRISNISARQFLQLLQDSYSGVSVHKIDGTHGPLMLIGVTARLPEKPNVKVFSLAQAVRIVAASKGNDADNRKQAMDDVLSLIQAALDELDSPEKSVMKVHEATQTLIFKGSPRELGVVADTLSALQDGQIRGLGGAGRANGSTPISPTTRPKE